MTCNAYRQQDEMFCPTCNLRWDVNDPEPPKCRYPGNPNAWTLGCRCRAEQINPKNPDVNPTCPIHGEALLRKKAMMIGRVVMESHRASDQKARERAVHAFEQAQDRTIPITDRIRIMQDAWDDWPNLPRRV